MQVTGKLDELMEDDDWALIFGADGRLKGIFIPPGKCYTLQELIFMLMVMLIQGCYINLYCRSG